MKLTVDPPVPGTDARKQTFEHLEVDIQLIQTHKYNK